MIALTFASCTKNTRPRYIQKNCCNNDVTQWVYAQSLNDSGTASYFFLPQVFAPGTEESNSNFKSVHDGVANYNMTIYIGEDVVWLYEGPGPINWSGDIASSQLAAQSGIYNYDLVVTFNNGEVVTLKEQNFCLIREYATCPEDINSCVLTSMFDISDTTMPYLHLKEEQLLDTRLYRRCKNP